MNPFIPRKPTGFDDEALFDQGTYDQLYGQAGQFINSPTAKVSKSNRGLIIRAAPPGGNGSTLLTCVITSLFSIGDLPVDYLGVTRWDFNANDGDGDVTGTEFKVAKCITGRQPAQETIDGILIVYTQYQGDVQRLATRPDTELDEYQAMHPRYMAWDPDVDFDQTPLTQYLIEVQRTVNGTGVLDDQGNQIKFVEVQPNRYWAYSPSLNGG